MGMHVGISSATIALAIAIIMYGQGCIDPVEYSLAEPDRFWGEKRFPPKTVWLRETRPNSHIAQQHTMHLIVPYSRHSTIVSFALPW